MSRILVAEDNDVNQRLIRRRLERYGYEVGIVENGELAVQCTYHYMPDLVFMDMSMPIKDGWTATREIKSYERTRRIPIVALTAHAMEDDRAQAIKCGCDDFIAKPIESEKLKEILQRFLKMGPQPSSQPIEA